MLRKRRAPLQSELERLAYPLLGWVLPASAAVPAEAGSSTAGKSDKGGGVKEGKTKGKEGKEGGDAEKKKKKKEKAETIAAKEEKDDSEEEKEAKERKERKKEKKAKKEGSAGQAPDAKRQREL